MVPAQSLLPRTHFDTRIFEGEAEARQAYLDRLNGVLDTEFLDPFRATMTAYRLGSLSVLMLTASARRSTRSAGRIARDRYETIGIQYILSGRAVGDADGRAVVSDAGSLMLLDYGRPFSIADCEPRTVLNVAVPRSLLPGMGSGADWHGAILQGPTADLLRGLMKGLCDTLSSMPESAGPAVANAFVALANGVVGSPPAAADPASILIGRAEQHVDAWIGSPDLGPNWLAAKLSVSRSELYSALERFGGVSRFIMQRRLDAACAALRDANDGRQIKAIAFALGFGSEAHFSRAFRATFGATPSEMRRNARRSEAA